MAQLTATSSGFHLINGAGAQLSPYMFLYSKLNTTGRMISDDGQSWTWDSKGLDLPYEIRVETTGYGSQREISEIRFHRIENGEEIHIGTMSLSDPIVLDVTPSQRSGDSWTMDLAVPIRHAIQKEALTVSGHRDDDLIDLSDPMLAVHNTVTVRTRGGDDEVIGGLGDDRIFGGSGDDIIVDQHGSNFIRGGRGDDYIEVSDPSGSSKLSGGSGDDTLKSGAGDDILRGGRGDDTLIAGSGDDRLIGGSGDDVLIAGLGEDVMRGGRGSDSFEINTGLFGRKVVQDFSAEDDLLVLLNFGGELEDLSITQQGKHLVLSDESESFEILLKNMDIDDLQTADIQLL